MFRTRRPDPSQLDVIYAFPEAQYMTQVTLAFSRVQDSPPGFHDSLSLWLSLAPNCQAWPNVNMLLHVEHRQWSTT